MESLPIESPPSVMERFPDKTREPGRPIAKRHFSSIFRADKGAKMPDVAARKEGIFYPPPVVEPEQGFFRPANG